MKAYVTLTWHAHYNRHQEFVHPCFFTPAFIWGRPLFVCANHAPDHCLRPSFYLRKYGMSHNCFGHAQDVVITKDKMLTAIHLMATGDFNNNSFFKFHAVPLTHFSKSCDPAFPRTEKPQQRLFMHEEWCCDVL